MRTFKLNEISCVCEEMKFISIYKFLSKYSNKPTGYKRMNKNIVMASMVISFCSNARALKIEL